MSFANVGKTWRVEEFPKYLRGIESPAWARAVCLHHCGAPSLSQRPLGFIVPKHIENIRDYYRDKLGWSAGPHLFVDEHLLHGMTPLSFKGIHAKSFNGSAIGIEVLGDYDREDPFMGRGLACWINAARATKALLEWLGLGANNHTILFHRDDPKTSKSCPGKLIKKEWFFDLLKTA